MTNLFSTFDPNSWLTLPLNWISCILFFLILPTLFWVTPSSRLIFLKNLFNYIYKEFNAILSPQSTPGILLIPLTAFIFIICNNALGLLPYIFTASRHLRFTIALALPLWIGHILLASTKTPNSILAHLVPLGTPVILMPFIVLIELVRRVIRPLTLSVRLAANIIAGHLLLALLAGQAPSLNLIYLATLIRALILLAVLECAVRVIQAYVFRVLSTLYLNEVNAPALN